MNTEPITPSFNLPPDALVLELGSGHRPHSRADVLTDKYLQDIERGGGLIIDRPFVQTGAENLPFKENSFDFILCRHVLEHVEDPVAFFEEISRVGRAGYIETPSAIWEHLHPTRPYHRWFILEIEGRLVLMPKSLEHTKNPFGKLFETTNQQSPEYRLFLRRYANLFYVRHRWQEKIYYEVEPTDEELQAWFQQPWDETKVAHYIATRSRQLQARDLLLGAMDSVWHGMLRRILKPRPTRRRDQIDLVALMQCPKCQHQTLALSPGQINCPNCDWQTMAVLPE